jgi:hypothetical protein
MRKIMRATLHDRASNTYYGQWLRAFLEEQRSKGGANTHWGFDASAKSAAVEARERIFPGNRGSVSGEFHRPEKETFGKHKVVRYAQTTE